MEASLRGMVSLVQAMEPEGVSVYPGLMTRERVAQSYGLWRQAEGSFRNTVAVAPNAEPPGEWAPARGLPSGVQVQRVRCLP